MTSFDAALWVWEVYALALLGVCVLVAGLQFLVHRRRERRAVAEFAQVLDARVTPASLLEAIDAKRSLRVERGGRRA